MVAGTFSEQKSKNLALTSLTEAALPHEADE